MASLTLQDRCRTCLAARIRACPCPGWAADGDPRRHPVENYWRAATTLSNRDSGIRRTSCAFSAFSAEKRLHDPVHENDKSDRKLFRNCIADLGAPLRNRTVDLLLTIGTAHRPERTSCTDCTRNFTESTERTHCARHPVHEPVHAPAARPGHSVTLSDPAARGRQFMRRRDVPQTGGYHPTGRAQPPAPCPGATMARTSSPSP